MENYSTIVYAKAGIDLKLEKGLGLFCEVLVQPEKGAPFLKEIQINSSMKGISLREDFKPSSLLEEIDVSTPILQQIPGRRRQFINPSKLNKFLLFQAENYINKSDETIRSIEPAIIDEMLTHVAWGACIDEKELYEKKKMGKINSSANVWGHVQYQYFLKHKEFLYVRRTKTLDDKELLKIEAERFKIDYSDLCRVEIIVDGETVKNAFSKHLLSVSY